MKKIGNRPRQESTQVIETTPVIRDPLENQDYAIQIEFEDEMDFE